MGKRQAAELETLKQAFRTSQQRISRRNAELEEDFQAAIKALGEQRIHGAQLYIDGHAIPFVISDMQITRDQGGLTDIKIIGYPQPPRMV